MFMKLSVVLILLVVAAKPDDNHNWDLAVVINDQIELLQSNGSLVGSTEQQFQKLKAVTFDNVRHQFVVSEMDVNYHNDTISMVQLTRKTDVTPIIKDLPDDVQGLAIDSITDTLYWTDSNNHTINYVSLNDSSFESKILFQFTDQNPQDVAIDVCHGYIYWTNSNINKPSIERSKLDGSEHEMLIDSDLVMPAGIAIDYKTRRLYWADMREGIYYRIESTNFDGKEREIVYEGTHSKPFGITVDEEAIYWTDVNNNALWKIAKFNNKHSVPKRLRNFNEKPMGIVAKNVQITNLPDCHILAEAMKNYNQSTVEVFIKESDDEKTDDIIIRQCLNQGKLLSNECNCAPGFSGRFCEISICHNFCMHGNCHLSSTLNYPQCRCPRGYTGKRCERDICDGFCLNNARCSYQNSKLPKCYCPDGFTGNRCEISIQIGTLCSVFCQEERNDLLVLRNNDFVCRCERGGTYKIEKSNITSSQQQSMMLLQQQQEDRQSFMNLHFDEPSFIIMTCVMLLMLIACVVLSMIVCSLRRRPRIKKRIIVNKNVTPLTYRPQQPTTEQCEITIENCCNMNVCETPCFEPPQLRGCQASKTDDKKTLLSNMESGEDFY